MNVISYSLSHTSATILQTDIKLKLYGQIQLLVEKISAALLSALSHVVVTVGYLAQSLFSSPFSLV